MLLYLVPCVHGDSVSSGGLDKIKIIFLRLKLEQHGHVVEFSSRRLSLKFARHLVRFEEQNISRIGHREELPLTNGVILPDFRPRLTGDLVLMALGLLNMVGDFALPQNALRLGGRPQVKLPLNALYDYGEVSLFQGVRNHLAAVLVKINHTQRGLLIAGTLEVFELSVFQYPKARLPANKPVRRVFLDYALFLL